MVLKLPHVSECDVLTESSLNQDSVCVVRMNQYFLAPPFMKPMLLMVSQPLRMICKTAEDICGAELRDV